MPMVNQEEEAMKSEPLINVNSRVDDGDSLSEEVGVIHHQLEDEIMVAGKLQEQRVDKCWWWNITKSRKLYIVLLLLVAISAGGVAIVFQYRRNDNNEVLATGQVKSGYVNGNYQSNKDNVDNYLSRQSDRMAQRSYSRVEPPEEIGYFNIYIREPNTYGHRRALRRVRFPVARYSRRRFPLVGPFVNFQLSMPIFVDPFTGQTIIHLSKGSTYIIPPLINVYGKIFSIGQLIASGYASFINTGIGMTGNPDFATFFHPGPVMGPGIPRINSRRGGFMGGVRTNYRSFFPPKFSKTPTYDGYPDYESRDEDNYQSQPYSNDKYYKKRPESIYKEPTCSDGVKNQYERLVDCGGPCSGKNTCADGFSCINGADCRSGVCQFGSCQASTTSTATTTVITTTTTTEITTTAQMTTTISTHCDDPSACTINGGTCAAACAHGGTDDDPALPGGSGPVVAGGITCDFVTAGISCPSGDAVAYYAAGYYYTYTGTGAHHCDSPTTNRCCCKQAIG